MKIKHIMSGWFFSLILALFCMLFSFGSVYAQDKGQGKLIMSFAAGKTEADKENAMSFKKSGLFQRLAEDLNKHFNFPSDFQIKFSSGAGPAFDPKTNAVLMSYDFINYLNEKYKATYPGTSKEEMVHFSARVSMFLACYELGHAFINLYNLPIAGDKNAAADKLGTLLMLEYDRYGDNIVIDSADTYEQLSKYGAEKSYKGEWDSYALSPKIFRNTICCLYAKQPKNLKEDLDNWDSKQMLAYLNKQGAYYKAAYKKQLDLWIPLLKPHLKK